VARSLPFFYRDPFSSHMAVSPPAHLSFPSLGYLFYGFTIPLPSPSSCQRFIFFLLSQGCTMVLHPLLQTLPFSLPLLFSVRMIVYGLFFETHKPYSITFPPVIHSLPSLFYRRFRLVCPTRCGSFPLPPFWERSLTFSFNLCFVPHTPRTFPSISSPKTLRTPPHTPPQSTTYFFHVFFPFFRFIFSLLPSGLFPTSR